ncbi:MAG TPA: amidohydrolase [Chloroflexota bacterium]|nr:amidohydrolase [Chloroflexota bacterium]
MTDTTIYAGASFMTGDPLTPRISCVAVDGGRIVATGEYETVRAALRGSRVVDLGGGFVLPGFNDCHMHILSFGLGLGRVDVSPAAAPSIEAIQERIRERMVTSKVGWLLGRGYNQNLLAEGRHPNRDDLDAVTTERPVVLSHTSGHVLTANSRAIELAGITSQTDDPPGGEIERDESGRPTGVLKETARQLLSAMIPEPTMAEATEAILAASRALAVEGITSASDAATGSPETGTREFDAYRAAFETGQLVTRIELMPQITLVAPEDGPTLQPADFGCSVNPDWLRIGSVKIFSDGALTTRTAALREPYCDAPTTGLLTWPPERLRELIRRASASGWQIATHAIGDRAIDAVLDALEAAREGGERDSRRHRIEHCTILDRMALARIKSLAIVPVLQPEDIAVLGDAYEPALGPERAANNSPVGWFEEEEIPIAFSSDRPVTPGNPLVGIRAAVERRTASGRVLGPAHRISAQRAVMHYTGGAAYATRTETVKGCLAPGMLADMVVLDRDITSCPSEEITEACVITTIVDGRLVFPD